VPDSIRALEVQDNHAQLLLKLRNYSAKPQQGRGTAQDLHKQDLLTGRKLAQCSDVFPWQTGTRGPSLLVVGLGSLTHRSTIRLRRKEATMEFSTRLNVLAALLSFGFIAAIVFGMV
jgi:hypothetical protein